MPTTRGDVYVASEPGGLTRVVVVTNPGPTERTWQVALVHTAPELACDIDLMIAPGAAGPPFPMVVQPDLRGVLWVEQLRSRIGHLDLDSLNPTPHGLPLTGPADPRWTFKAEEGRDLRAICGPCTRDLLAAW